MPALNNHLQNEIVMDGFSHPFLRKIYDIIEMMIDDRELGASKLAEMNDMCLRTLNRKLQRLAGLTAGEMIRQYRLKKSLLLLREGHNVSEAAYLVGFETPAYFSQCFKFHYGVSPKYVISPERSEWKNLLPLNNETGPAATITLPEQH